MVGQGRLTSAQGQQLLHVVRDFMAGDVIGVVPRRFYEHMEGTPAGECRATLPIGHRSRLPSPWTLRS